MMQKHRSEKHILRQAIAPLILVATVLTLVVYLMLKQSDYSQVPAASPSARRGATSEEIKQCELFKQAGLHGDQSQVPAMIAALQTNSYPYVAQTALEAVGRVVAFS